MHRLRALASGLLLFTGVAHVAQYFATSGADGPGMAVFGAIYFGIGVLLRLPGTWPLWLAVALPAVGGLGGSQLLREHIDPVLALFVAIDLVVVGSCLWLLVAHRRA
jgi:hypothetical protein